MENKNNLSIPVAIVLAGVLIAGAVLFTRLSPQTVTNTGGAGQQVAGNVPQVGGAVIEALGQYKLVNV